MLQAKKFRVVLKFDEDILGLAPFDSNIYSSHKIEASRKAIKDYAGFTGDGKKATFKNVKGITKKAEKEQLESIRRVAELYLGDKISDTDWESWIANGLTKNHPLYSKLSEAKNLTVFHRDETGFPILARHQLKGAMKSFFEVYCRRNPASGKGKVLESINHTMSIANEHFFIKGNGKFYKDKALKKRANVCMGLEGRPVSFSRPLRAKTAQGDRNAIAHSEYIESGVYLVFTIKSFVDEFTTKKLKEIMTIGEDFGFSQWRNAGYGTFEVVSLKEYKE